MCNYSNKSIRCRHGTIIDFARASGSFSLYLFWSLGWLVKIQRLIMTFSWPASRPGYDSFLHLQNATDWSIFYWLNTHPFLLPFHFSIQPCSEPSKLCSTSPTQTYITIYNMLYCLLVSVGALKERTVQVQVRNLHLSLENCLTWKSLMYCFLVSENPNNGTW